MATGDAGQDGRIAQPNAGKDRRPEQESATTLLQNMVDPTVKELANPRRAVC